MIKLTLFLDLVAVIFALFFSRNEISAHKEIQIYGKWVILIVFITLLLLTKRRYDGSYNSLRFYWKDESKSAVFYKGVLVILSLVLPWIPILLLGMLW